MELALILVILAIGMRSAAREFPENRKDKKK